MLHAISFNLHDFAWSYLICCFIIKVRERGDFAGSCISTFLLADDDWSTSPTVTRTDDAILGKDHHGAGTFDVMENVFDTFSEGFTLNNEQSHQLSRIGTTRRHLCKVHVLLEQKLSKFILVYYLSYSANGKAAKMRVHDEWLGICIANHADARCSSFKLVECRFKLRSEV